MKDNDLATIKRAIGDASIIRDTLMEVAIRVENGEMEDDEALHFLRKVVDKCDYISTEIESNFK